MIQNIEVKNLLKIMFKIRNLAICNAVSIVMYIFPFMIWCAKT